MRCGSAEATAARVVSGEVAQSDGGHGDGAGKSGLVGGIADGRIDGAGQDFAEKVFAGVGEESGIDDTSGRILAQADIPSLRILGIDVAFCLLFKVFGAG